MPTSLLLLRARVAWRRRELAGVPRPSDEPRAEVPGPDPVTIVAIGDGALSGWGVASHQIGLLGHLARAIAAVSGRGVRVLGEEPGATGDLATRAQRAPVADADGVLLVPGLGAAIATATPARWEAQLRSTLAAVVPRMCDDARLTVVAFPPARALPVLHGRLGRDVDRIATRLNEVTRAVVATLPGVDLIPLGVAEAPSAEIAAMPARYREWAHDISAHLTIPAPPAGWRDDVVGRLRDRVG